MSHWSTLRTVAGRPAMLALLTGLLACSPTGDTIVDPAQRPLDARGGVPGPPGGGGSGGDADTALVDLSGGLATAATQVADVIANNGRKLELSTPGGSHAFQDAWSLANTHAAGLANCATNGVFDEGLSPSDMLDLMLDALRNRDFWMHIENDAAESGTASDAHMLKRGWSEGIPSGRVETWIGSENNKTSILGANPALVTRVVLGPGMTLYTFHAGNGVVVFSQLSGAPKDHPTLVCYLLDDVEVTVDMS